MKEVKLFPVILFDKKQTEEFIVDGYSLFKVQSIVHSETIDPFKITLKPQACLITMEPPQIYVNITEFDLYLKTTTNGDLLPMSGEININSTREF